LKPVPPCGPVFFWHLKLLDLLLRDTDEDDPLVGLEISAIDGRDVIFALVAFERQQWDIVLFSEGLHSRNKPIVQRTDHCRRWHWKAEVLT
jgi:hypothetical protein